MALKATGPLAAFRLEKSRLGILLEQQSLPTLGEIAWAVRTDIRWVPYRMADGEYQHWRDQEYYPFYWTFLDEKFGGRPDYRLWRLVAMHYFTSKYSERWPEVSKTAVSALECPEDVIVWGALSVLAGYLTNIQLRELFPHDKARLEIAIQCEHLILAGLAPIRGGETGCALIKALMWSAIQLTHYEHDRVVSLDQAREFFDRFETSLEDADPHWQPGAILRVSQRLKHERTRGREISPYDPIELEIRIVEALFKARAVAIHAIQVLDKVGEHLLKRATLLAFSSWRFTRSMRMRHETFHRENPHYDTEYNPATLRRKEMFALKRLVEALRDAGYNMEAAFAAWLLLTLVPEELLADFEFHHIGTYLARTVRSLGLAVPQRFVRPRDENRDKAKHRRMTSSSPPDEPQAISTPNVTPEIWKRARVYPASLRVIQDHGTDARWREIDRADPDTSASPWSGLARVVDCREELAGDTNVLRAAFGLCLKYDRLREAAQVAEHLELNKTELLDLAHSVKRALQLDLLAVDHEVHKEWRKVLRRNWAQLPNRASLSGDEILVLHEVLLGRYPSILRDARADVSRMLALRLYNHLDDEAVRELLDVRSGSPAFRRGLATVTIKNLQRALERMQSGAMGKPVCLSVARLECDSVSLIAVGSGRVQVEEVAISGIYGAPTQLRSTYEQWLTHGIQRLTIPAHPTIEKLVRAIIDLGFKIDPSCRWLVLALEPDLASLPWNSLVAAPNTHGPVISLVPSFSWFERAIDRRNRQTVVETPNIMVSPDHELACLAAKIKNDEQRLGDLVGSCGVIVGHGHTTVSGIANVALGKHAVTMHEWLKLAAHRVLMVHSCHSGRVSHTHPSDLGGLPGIALSIGCHLFFAPVTEVPVDAAIALHDEVVRHDGPAELGLRYRTALRRNAAVALYNLYGFANEKVQAIARRAHAKAAS